VERVEAVIARQQHTKHVSMATDADATIEDVMFSMPAIAGQQRDKHVSAAGSQHATIEELLEAFLFFYNTADDQSVSKSWFQGPCGSHDRIFISVDIYEY
jgi:hypothetical protein